LTDLDILRTAKLIASGGHTDLTLLNTATPEEDGGENTSKREEIGVGQVRGAIAGLRLTQSISKNRVMIVDSIDSVNANGQNALLKTLEEPTANTYIFLVCHNARRVLDTVKSRCNVLDVADPTFKNWLLAIRGAFDEPLDIDSAGLEDLYDLSGHSIGLALDIVNGGAQNIYDNLLESIFTGDPMNIQKFAEDISRGNMFNLFKVFIERFFSSVIDYYRNGRSSISERNGGAANFLTRNDPKSIVEKYDYSRRLIHDIEVCNLDKKHCISVLLSKMGSTCIP
jgi:hypothetical protein